MGAPKLKPYPREKNKKGQNEDKLKINDLKKKIAEKLKDPKALKKASLIISEMINSKNNKSS